MKRFIALFLAVLLVVPVGAFMSASAAESDWKSLWVTHFNAPLNEGSGCIITSSENNTASQAWRYVAAFKPVDGGYYQLVEVADYSQTGGDLAIIAVPAGGFIWMGNYGNDYPSLGMEGPDYTTAACTASIDEARAEWAVGMIFEFRNLNLESLVAPTTTPSLNYYDDSYVSTAQYRIVGNGSVDEAGVESVVVDGAHNDNGWISDEWITIDGNTGTWQKTFNDMSLSGKFQLRTDANNVYGAVVINTTPVAGSGNGTATNVRVWFNTTSADKYTSYFDFYWNGTGVGIASSVASTGAKAAGSTTSNSVIIEFSIPRSEIGAASLSQIPYYISLSTNTGSEEPCLYYPKMSSYSSPYTAWLKNCDGDLNVAAKMLNDFEYILSLDGTFYTIKSIGTYGSKDVVIPSSYNGLPVRVIDKEAFARTDITSVTIPGSIETIGQAAFGQCGNLRSVTLGEGVREIGFGAFLACSALESISFPASLTRINNLAFSSCNSLLTVTIPATVTNVGSNAFSHSADLTDIYCEASSRPATWLDTWAQNCDAEIHWGNKTPVLNVVSKRLFWVTHFNDTISEGAGAVFTETYVGGAWNLHIAFTPIEGTNAYKITAVSNGTNGGTAAPLAIPEGGFVYTINKGNDYPSLGMDGPDYTSPSCDAALEDALSWYVGDQFVFENFDPASGTVPTSTSGVNWYDDAYVCTATYSTYNIAHEPPAESEGDNSEDDSSEEPVYDNVFWVTHYNNVDEGAGVIFTDTDTAGPWWLHVALEPASKANTYKIVEISNGLESGGATALDVPAGGFVYALHVGNDYPTLDAENPDGGFAGKPNYSSESVLTAAEKASKWVVGDEITLAGITVSAGVIPTTTPDTAWYDPSYVCTATYMLNGESGTDTSSEPESSEPESSEPESSEPETSDPDVSVDEYDIGDVNADGDINQFDYLLVKRAYFDTYTLTAEQEKRADCNYDNTVNQFDYLLLKRHYFETYVIVQK